MKLIFLLPLLLQSAKPDAVQITLESPSRRIVTDAGAGGYQAFPDVCRAKNGDLLCVFYAGYGHISQPTAALPKGGRVCMIRSKDEGKTWGDPMTIVDTPADDRDPSICSLPNGDLLCNFFIYGKNAECDTCVARSRDGGATWSEPEIVAPRFATSSPIRRLRSGRLLLPIYTVDGGGKRSFPAVCLSDNGGKSWSSAHPIAQSSGMTLDETDFFERMDGTILAVMRQVMCGAESKDGGVTWGAPFELGFPGHCPYMLMTRNGVLLMAHRVPETSLHYSVDEGRTWQGPILIDHFIGAYPSMVNLKDGQVLVVFYEEGKGSAIRAVTLRIFK
ncbi:MAG: sialidase family protein [Chthonomonadales bacterium]